jgi:hypothetical protein
MADDNQFEYCKDCPPITEPAERAIHLLTCKHCKRKE